MMAKSGVECGGRRMGAGRWLNSALSSWTSSQSDTSGRLRCFEILVNGALRDRTAAGDLSLFPSQGVESENFLDVSHGQPFLAHRWFPPGTQRAIGLSSALLLHRS